jgi:hypothetical protein|tara:strand:+ start:87 stop:215 length:129 start_codon:yes stop_codon:yes gene_type:complete
MGIIKRKKVGSYKPKQDNVIKLTKYLENIDNKLSKKVLYNYE